MLNSRSHHGNRRNQPVIVRTPITGECVYFTGEWAPKLRIEYRDFEIKVICESVHCVWTPETIHKLKHFCRNAPIIKILLSTQPVSLYIIPSWDPLNIYCDVMRPAKFENVKTQGLQLMIHTAFLNNRDDTFIVRKHLNLFAYHSRGKGINSKGYSLQFSPSGTLNHFITIPVLVEFHSTILHCPCATSCPTSVRKGKRLW